MWAGPIHPHPYPQLHTPGGLLLGGLYLVEAFCLDRSRAARSTSPSPSHPHPHHHHHPLTLRPHPLTLITLSPSHPHPARSRRRSDRAWRGTRALFAGKMLFAPVGSHDDGCHHDGGGGGGHADEQLDEHLDEHLDEQAEEQQLGVQAAAHADDGVSDGLDDVDEATDETIDGVAMGMATRMAMPMRPVDESSPVVMDVPCSTAVRVGRGLRAVRAAADDEEAHPNPNPNRAVPAAADDEERQAAGDACARASFTSRGSGGSEPEADRGDEQVDPRDSEQSAGRTDGLPTNGLANESPRAARVQVRDLQLD